MHERSTHRYSSRDDLIDQGATVDVTRAKHKVPDFEIFALEQVAGLGFEHGVLVGNVDELEVVLSLAVGNVRQIRVALLAVLANGERVILVILLQERLRVVVAGKQSVNLPSDMHDSSLTCQYRSWPKRCRRPAAGCLVQGWPPGRAKEASGDCVTRPPRQAHRWERMQGRPTTGDS